MWMIGKNKDFLLCCDNPHSEAPRYFICKSDVRDKSIAASSALLKQRHILKRCNVKHAPVRNPDCRDNSQS